MQLSQEFLRFNRELIQIKNLNNFQGTLTYTEKPEELAQKIYDMVEHKKFSFGFEKPVRRLKYSNSYEEMVVHVVFNIATIIDNKSDLDEGDIRLINKNFAVLYRREDRSDGLDIFDIANECLYQIIFCWNRYLKHHTCKLEKTVLNNITERLDFYLDEHEKKSNNSTPNLTISLIKDNNVKFEDIKKHAEIEFLKLYEVCKKNREGISNSKLIFLMISQLLSALILIAGVCLSFVSLAITRNIAIQMGILLGAIALSVTTFRCSYWLAGVSVTQSLTIPEKYFRKNDKKYDDLIAAIDKEFPDSTTMLRKHGDLSNSYSNLKDDPTWRLATYMGM